MFVNLYHPELGMRRFWEGDAIELVKFGWYQDPGEFPKTPPTLNSEADYTGIIEPKRRGRPKK